MISQNLEEPPALRRRFWPWAIFASLLLHGAAYASLDPVPSKAEPAHRKTQLRFDVVETQKPPSPPSLPAEPPAAQPRPAPKAKLPPALPPQAVEPPPASVTPAGVTLAVDGAGNAFSMPLGGGGPLEPRRVHAPAPVSAPPKVKPAPVSAPTVPALVAVSDLSTKPTPPTLGAALERNYPADARRRGLSGTAKVRARIDPDGVVRRVSLLEESAAGFGSACSRTLNGSRWAAPKDKAGRSVATEIRYTCRFVVDP